MRKLIACLLAVVLLAGVLPGAGLAEETPTLKVYLFDPEKTDSALVEETLSKLVCEKIGCNIDIVWRGANGYFQSMALALASNEQMDVVFDHSGSGWYDRAKQGAYMDLTALLELTPTLKSSLPDYVWTAALVDGKIALVPTYKDLCIELGVYADHADVVASGLDAASVHRTADLEPLLSYLAGKEGSYVWQATSNGCGIDALERLSSFYDVHSNYIVARKDEPQTLLNYYMTDEYEAAVKLAYEFAQKGYIPVDAPTRDSSSYSTNGAGKNYGVSYTQYCPLAEIALSEAYGAQLDYIPMTQAVVTNDSLTGTGFCIPAKSEYPEYAIRFIELLSCDADVANTLCYGVEGVHYNFDENGRVVRAENYTELYNPALFAMGDIRARSLLATDPADKNEQYEAWNAKAVESPYLGFRVDKSEIEAYEASLETVAAEYAVLLSLGALDPAQYLPVFRQALIDAGAETVTANIQAQYDAWAAAK